MLLAHILLCHNPGVMLHVAERTASGCSLRCCCRSAEYPCVHQLCSAWQRCSLDCWRAEVEQVCLKAALQQQQQPKIARTVSQLAGSRLAAGLLEMPCSAQQQCSADIRRAEVGQVCAHRLCCSGAGLHGDLHLGHCRSLREVAAQCILNDATILRSTAVLTSDILHAEVGKICAPRLCSSGPGLHGDLHVGDSRSLCWAAA